MFRDSTPGLAVSPFADDLIDLPSAVADASEEFATALQRVRDANARVAELSARLDAAKAADAEAARSAVQAGVDPPPATTAKPTDALTRAARAVPEAVALAAEAQRTFLDVCVEHFDELRAALRERQAEVHAAGMAALDGLASTVRETVALNHLGRELDLGWMRARAPQFQPVRVEPRRDVATPVIASATAILSLNLPHVARVA